MISFIVAMAQNGVIGSEGSLPWNLPGEMALFKERTTGHPIIMGRKTHESIGRTLPERTNIVISRDPNYKADAGSVVVNSLQKALGEAEKAEGSDEIFLIGGQSIYEQAMPYVDRIYLTKINANVEGDKYFEYKPEEWRQISSEKHKADDKNKYDYEFTVVERKR